jgi:chromosomal replication initiator protein
VPITKEFARQSLKVMGSGSVSAYSTKAVVRTVADHFSLETSQILGAKRQKEVVYPRQLVMYLLRELAHQSFPQIGEALGGKDHTTIIHGVDKIAKLRKTDSQVETDISNLQTKLGKA